MDATTKNKLEYLLQTKEEIKAALIDTGQTVEDSDTFRSYADKIRGIEGSALGARFVTFMSHDGSTELYVRLVAEGDNCADPVERGLISAPTKESTAQYDYSFVGWATDPDGAWDETALDAVTENKTVYAAYAASVRYYTVRFWDGDTLLSTAQVAYGGSSAYTPPAKDGYFFNAWEPTPTNITADTDCYAQYRLDIDFATASWADIAALSESGEARTYFSLGDTKSISFTGVTGTAYTMDVAIVGFNHDNLADGSGKAGISLLCKLPCGSEDMNTSKRTSDGVSSSYYAGGWGMCSMRTTLNGTVFNSFAAELQAVIKSVIKEYTYPTGSAKAGRTSNDKVWIPSTTELGITEFRSLTRESDGEKYENFDVWAHYDDGNFWTRTQTARSGGEASAGDIARTNQSYKYNVFGSSNWGASVPVIFGFCI